uniref:Transmembrane protein 235b n=1 Tax=Sphaeramia orbicularis TaxID=375764 RepID=A0A673ACE6_9TELE
MMRITFGFLVISAGVCGIMSFAFLATSLGTEYWYIIETNPVNMSDFEDMSSHSGLWTINEGRGRHRTPRMLHNPSVFVCALYAELHSAIVVVLPLSLVLLLLGGICGLVSSLAQSSFLLTGTASYFFICSKLRGLLTLCGVSLYIVYCCQALAETERLVGPEGLAYIHMSFGWSLGLAWLSYGLELLTGVLLLMAARMVKLSQSSPSAAGSFYIKYEK